MNLTLLSNFEDTFLTYKFLLFWGSKECLHIDIEDGNWMRSCMLVGGLGVRLIASAVAIICAPWSVNFMAL